jgi:hypothetical protein
MPALTVISIQMSDKWRAELAKLTALNVGVNVGVLDGATYADGKSVAYVAYINEKGLGLNPPRPFMARTIEKNAGKYVKGIAYNVKGRSLDRAAALAAFDKAGQAARGDMQRSIMDWPDDDPRPNRLSTIAKKARRAQSGGKIIANHPGKALVDTGVMVKSINYEVTG